MPNYDFRQLSSHDFEVLIRDLLQAEWKVVFQSFTAGRDQGIDLQFTHDGHRTIVQCKHFAGSGFRKLLAHVRNIEASKAAQIAPQRYVLAASVGMTPANKAALIAALSPNLRGPEDVIGRDDVNNLLGRHPEIEQAHFRLWLTSTTVLETVLHNAEVSDTEFEVRRVHSNLRKYVPNACYPRALELLDRGNIVIISGIPGIGKTTLAELLLYAHLERGYAPVLIRSNIRDAKKLLRRGVKQIFYFDDFLGQTFLGDAHGLLIHNQDIDLLDFMDVIRQSESRLVMTTREHILSNALQTSERFRHSLILEQRCILALADYSFSEKAKVLYNHIYFSDLPQEYRRRLVADDFFLSILAHRNFSPRQVEWLASYTRLKGIPSKDYRTFVTGIFDNPSEIWRHSFDRQISSASQSLLLALLSLGGNAHFAMLEPAWRTLHSTRAARYGYRSTPDAFRAALKELEGSFFKLKPYGAEFLNPSIKDFLQALVAESTDHTTDLLDSSCYFTQVNTLWSLSNTPPGHKLREYFLTRADQVAHKGESLLAKPVAVVVMRDPDGGTGHRFDVLPEGRLRVAVEMATVIDTKAMWQFCHKAAEHLRNAWRSGDTPDFDIARHALDWLEDVPAGNVSAIGKAAAAQLASALRLELLWVLRRGSAEDFYLIYDLPRENGRAAWSTGERAMLQESFREYLRDGLDENRSNCSTSKDLDDLASMLEPVADALGHNISTELDSIRETAAELQEREDRRPLKKLEKIEPPASSPEKDDVETVKRMFGTLLD